VLARAAIKLYDLLQPRLRRVALRNLELAGYPEPERRRIADGVFESLTRSLDRFLKFPTRTPQNISDWICYEGLEHFTTAMSQGRGVLVATAHLGNWELSAFAHAWMTAPMNVVVRPLDNARLDKIVERRRAFSGNKLIVKKEAARAVLTALRAGEAVGILIDQNVQPNEGVFIDFFGTQACAGTAFVKFAHHSRAPVVPGFALWEPKQSRYVLRFYPEIEMTGDVQADTQGVHKFLESVIRQYPDQYLWIHRRWKTRPPGEPDLYAGKI
jgi:Kdo2-lipid IVA lauroyltransferase/acyltransferase